MAEYKRWVVDQRELNDLSTLKARDLITNCFMEAQKEVFIKMRAKLGKVPDDETLKRDVIATVKMAFKERGLDYESPSKACLMEVVERLGSKAASLGTPDDIIDHHKEQIGKVLLALT